VDLQSKLPEVEVGTQDQPVWNCKKGEYVCSETWEAIQMKGFPVKWWKLVWNYVAIPRHSFLLWLVFRNALITKERMCGWGFQGDCLCLFCRGSIENRETSILPMWLQQTNMEGSDSSLFGKATEEFLGRCGKLEHKRIKIRLPEI
jgi:hypothetical protein